MVLPASPVAHAPREGIERWIEEIRTGLRLSPAGVLILVDDAVPEQLGRLVRALLSDHPDLEVLVDVRELEALPDGSVVVLAPAADAAGWLNEHRPLFARKALKVVLWCDRATSVALAQVAPDFFDWIAQRQECPPGVAEHAVWGLRRALCARAPGVLFVREPPSRDAFERVFRAAFPGRPLRWLDPEHISYSHLVEQVRSAGRAWVACASWSHAAAARFRWALAEARRRTRAVLVVPNGGEDWFWQVTEETWPLEEALSLLSVARANHPGRLAAASGLEPAALFGLVELLIRGYPERDLLSAMLASPDPGSGLGERLLSSGISGLSRRGWTMSSPTRRRLGSLIGLRRQVPRRPLREPKGWSLLDGPGPPFLREQASRIEYDMHSVPSSAAKWARIARLALDLGDADAASAWAERSLSLERSVEAQLILGSAREALHDQNREAGYLSGPVALERLAAEERHVDALLARGATAEALSFADEALRKRSEDARSGRAAGLRADVDSSGSDSERAGPARISRGALRRMPLLARALHSAGRFKDAEALLRRLLGLGLPVSEDPFAVGSGLASQPVLQALVRSPAPPVQMTPEVRASLTGELAEVLRAQGRHAEANELSSRLASPPEGASS